MKANTLAEQKGRPHMDNPKGRLYSDAEAAALMRKAVKLGYPMDSPDFFEHMTIYQLDEVITYNRYDC